MRVGVSILGEDIGAQHETENSSLLGISYDSNDEILEIATANISHRVANPKEIYVREEAGTLSAIEVTAGTTRNRLSSSGRFPRCRRRDLQLGRPDDDQHMDSGSPRRWRSCVRVPRGRQGTGAPRDN